nr:hypothetical protein [Sphaerisporangium cinnabarinum]
MRAAGRLLALAPLAVLVVAVAAAPATAVGRDGESGLEVSVDGVSFDPERLWSEWGAVSYAVSAPDGSRERYYSDSYGPRDSADGFLAFSVPTRTFPDGYCVTWAQVSGLRAQHARWNGDDPVCTTAQVAPSPTTPPPAPATDAPVASPPAEEPPAAATVEAPVETPDAPEPDVTEEPTEEPTEDPTTAAPVAPTPTVAPTTAGPDPVRVPLASVDRTAPPPPAGEAFPTFAAVGVGGLVAAAAGGVILLVRRVG